MPTSQSHRVASGIGRASALLASGTIVSRILGFVKVIVFAQVIGQFGQGADAFTLANQLPNTVYVIVAGGVLTAVLVPQIVRSALHHDGGTEMSLGLLPGQVSRADRMSPRHLRHRHAGRSRLPADRASPGLQFVETPICR